MIRQTVECVYVCERQRKREREREGGRGRERKRERGIERASRERFFIYKTFQCIKNENEHER